MAKNIFFEIQDGGFWYSQKKTCPYIYIYINRVVVLMRFIFITYRVTKYAFNTKMLDSF